MDTQTSYASMDAAAGVSAPAKPEPPPFAAERIYSLREVKSLVGEPSTSTIYRWIAQGIFPKQKRVGISRVGWLHSEVMKFISQCEAA